MSADLVEQLQALLPPVSYAPNGPRLLAQLTADSGSLGRAVTDLATIQGAVFPATAGDYLADWERVYDLIPPATADQSERVTAVEQAMADLGGQAPGYFVRLANQYQVSTTYERFAEPTLGTVAVGSWIYSGDWCFTWRLNAALADHGNAGMEARLVTRRPANTDLIFGYGAEVVDNVTAAVDRFAKLAHYLMPQILIAET